MTNLDDFLSHLSDDTLNDIEAELRRETGYTDSHKAQIAAWLSIVSTILNDRESGAFAPDPDAAYDAWRDAQMDRAQTLNDFHRDDEAEEASP